MARAKALKSRKAGGKAKQGRARRPAARKAGARGTAKSARPAKVAKPAKAARAGAGARKPAGKKAAAPGLPMPAPLYEARREADVVAIPARTVVAIDGEGSPHDERFGRAIGALYGVAYTLKFTRKPRGGDFRIGPLEGRWWAEGAALTTARPPPPESWRWRLRLAVPADVTDDGLADVIQHATMKKGGKLEGSADARRVQLERIPAARLGRILHVGPYSDELASFERIRAALDAAGLRGGFAHLEVYLSDPQRTAPAKLKTVLLRELA